MRDSQSFEFSDAARLYATHATLIDQMWEELKNSLAAFMEAITEVAREQFSSGSFKSKRERSGSNQTYHSWWITDDVCNDRDLPYVFTHPTDPSIIADQKIVLNANVKQARRSQFPDLIQARTLLTLEPTMSLEPGRENSLFAVVVDFSDADDPAALIADALLRILNVLAAAQRDSIKR